MSSSAHVHNKKKGILILGKGPVQGLEDTLTAEKMYSINFTMTKKKFCLSLHYSEVNSYLFVNGKKIGKFKAKDSANASTSLCLGNISKDWSVNNMRKAELNEYVNEFCVDYGALNPLNFTETVPIIHNYFMPKYKIK